MLKFVASNVKKVVALEETTSPVTGIAVFQDGTQAMFSVVKHLEEDGTPKFLTADDTLKAGWKVEGEWLRDPNAARGGLSLATAKRRTIADE